MPALNRQVPDRPGDGFARQIHPSDSPDDASAVASEDDCANQDIGFYWCFILRMSIECVHPFLSEFLATTHGWFHVGDPGIDGRF
jgi:hypothetical protein